MDRTRHACCECARTLFTQLVDYLIRDRVVDDLSFLRRSTRPRGYRGCLTVGLRQAAAASVSSLTDSSFIKSAEGAQDRAVCEAGTERTAWSIASDTVLFAFSLDAGRFVGHGMRGPIPPERLTLTFLPDLAHSVNHFGPLVTGRHETITVSVRRKPERLGLRAQRLGGTQYGPFPSGEVTVRTFLSSGVRRAPR